MLVKSFLGVIWIGLLQISMGTSDSFLATGPLPFPPQSKRTFSYGKTFLINSSSYLRGKVARCGTPLLETGIGGLKQLIPLGWIIIMVLPRNGQIEVSLRSTVHAS